LYICTMKIIPFMLILLLAFSGIIPCEGSFAHFSANTAEVEACHDTEDKHSCCESPAEKDSTPVKDHCSEECSCYCCMLIITPLSDGTSFATKLEADEKKPWQVSNYTHDFTPVIWQPPQLG